MNTVDNAGMQCIHLAAQAGCLESINFLIGKCNISVDQASCESRVTPLHVAAKVVYVNLQISSNLSSDCLCIYIYNHLYLSSILCYFVIYMAI